MQLIEVKSQEQKLRFYEHGLLLFEFLISTGKNGMGECQGSYQTPRGRHYIYEKIGQDLPYNTVFVNSLATGEYYEPWMKQAEPQRDWILTRILKLQGLESGKNLGGKVDTLARYIYLHGTSAEELLGVPASKGCIRLHPQDMMSLFDKVKVGAFVWIE